MACWILGLHAGLAGGAVVRLRTPAWLAARSGISPDTATIYFHKPGIDVRMSDVLACSLCRWALPGVCALCNWMFTGTFRASDGSGAVSHAVSPRLAATALDNGIVRYAVLPLHRRAQYVRNLLLYFWDS